MSDDKSEIEARESRARKAPSSRTVHDAILLEGTEELERPSSALAWSGLAAGLSMGFSLVAEGLLRSALPDAPWRPLVSNFGYSVGFVIVIMGRQQLFTENTLTPILPLMQFRDLRTLANVARLWVIILLANLAGAALIGWVLVQTDAFEAGVRDNFLEIGREAMAPGFGLLLLRGIFAGWLIALIVWLLPFAEVARIYIIILLSYVIGLGQMSHVVAGSIEAFAVAAAGETSWSTALLGYTLPTLIGNVLGGVTLVAALNHAQVVAGKEAPADT